MYPASSSLRAWTLRLPSVVFIRFLSALKVSDSFAARALMIPSRKRSWINRSRFGAALFCFETARGSESGSCLRKLSFFAVDCLATVFPHNNCTKQHMQPAKADCHKPVGKRRRTKERKRPKSHETQTHRGNCPDREHAARDHAGAVKQKPHTRNRVDESGANQDN